MKRWLLIGFLFIVVTLVILVFLALSGMSIGTALADIAHGSLGSPAKISETLAKATPLLIASAAVFIGLRAGLFNIGAEGQFIIGALGSGIIGSRIDGVFGLIIAVIVGTAVGGLWAFPAGWIKAYRGGHEVITTIMLNSVAGFLAVGLVSGPLKKSGQQSPITPGVLFGLPSVHLGGFDISLGTVIALVIPIVLGMWLVKTVRGYEIEATGQNIHAAKTAGISSKQIIVQTMMVSGALAGLAGAIQVLAYSHRFYPDISSGTGYDALGVALLAGSTSIALIPAAIGFGILYQASPLLQIDGLPKGVTDILLALFIILGAAIRFRRLKNLG